jgi:hypothetical protein
MDILSFKIISIHLEMQPMKVMRTRKEEQSKKQSSVKSAIDAGIGTNFNLSFSDTLFGEVNSVGKGSESLRPKKIDV